MFYERFVELCSSRGVTPSRAAQDAGLSKSTVTRWKQRPDALPAGRALQLLCDYFQMSASELLGQSEGDTVPTPAASVSPDSLKFALFGGGQEITDEMFQEVLDFAAFVRQREAKKASPNREGSSES